MHAETFLRGNNLLLNIEDPLKMLLLQVRDSIKFDFRVHRSKDFLISDR